jgi:signal transduction histidine kinase
VFFFVQLLLSDSMQALMINIVLFGVITAIGLLLIKSVQAEVEAREKVERLAKDLEKANARLKELDRQKTEFVSIASHQLRSPLTAIKGYASLLLEGSYGKVSVAGTDAIKKIFDSSRYMAASIEDFLSVSRIELGTAKYDMKPLDAASMAKEVTEELIPAAKDKQLELAFKDRCDGKCSIVGDIGKLRQVVLNLIDNSIKYTPKGGITVTTELDSVKRVVRIMITDTGVGIPTEVMPTLFKKFSRAKNANEVNVMGTGLGLFVAKQFVEAHKGKLWAESLGQGKGSSFIIELPLSS